MVAAPKPKRSAPRARVVPADEAEGVEPITQVLRRFRLVFNAVKAHFQQVEKRTGIGGAQLWALSLIQRQPGVGVSELARSMDIHQSTASNLVKALVTRQLVQADRAGTDRRAVQLRVCPAGTALLKKAPGPLTGVLPDALSSLDARTLKRLDADLAKLIAVLDGDGGGANIPLGQ